MLSTDHHGRLRPDALKQPIPKILAENKQPFFVGLTAGTTVIGSFDSVTEAAALTQKHNIWLHIDGVWGGPVLLSEQHQQLLVDIALTDSFVWDAHKLMNIPLTASALLVKDKHILKVVCSGGGRVYLFHEDEYAEFNLGSQSLQCGWRVDSLKFWLSWKAVGSTDYARKVDKLMAIKALYAGEDIIGGQAHSAGLGRALKRVVSRNT